MRVGRYLRRLLFLEEHINYMERNAPVITDPLNILHQRTLEVLKITLISMKISAR